MRQFFTALAAGAALAACVWAQTSSSTTSNTSATTQTNTNATTTNTNTSAQTNTNANVNRNGATATSNATVNAELEKSLDAKKAKPGDPVTAKSTSDTLLENGVKIPRGSKLIGHVTRAQAHTKEQAQSELGIIFDRAEVKGGEQVAFHAFVQALTAPVQAAVQSDNDMNGGMGGMTPQPGMSGGGGGMGVPPTGGVVGGVTNGVGQTVGQTANTAGGVTGGVANGVTGGVGGRLTSNAQGAVNMPGLTLNTAAANATDGSIITSNSKTVKLDSGTQLLLRVIAQ
jgi:hypothetical protein